METIVKCKECSYEGNIEDFPTTKYYFQDEFGAIEKDAVFLCPNCDAEGDRYFDIIEKNLNVDKTDKQKVCAVNKTYPECGHVYMFKCTYCKDYIEQT